MPEIKEVLRFLELVEKHQPVHSYGLAMTLGNPTYTTWTWKWIHYFEELGVLTKTYDDGARTSRKEYMLSEKGKRLLEILRDVWAEKRLLNIASYSRQRPH